jgi:hypothetical protein
MFNRRLLVFAAVAGVALALPAARAQYDLTWHTVDGGGATFSAGGTFQLGGTIGQHDAGSFAVPMTGGSFSLVGGFWPAATSLCTCPGDLNGDSLRNGGDVQQFVGCILSGGTCGCADMNGSGSLDPTDVNLFVSGLLASQACP